MADRTHIEWAANADGTPGATWNPIVGCSVLSPGCKRCYAMREAARNERQMAALDRVSPYAGLTEASKAGPVWNGRLNFVESALRKPLSWKKPRTVFVNSMGDLFHEDAPDEWIDQVFAVMALCPQHTFIVLTKRSWRMQRYIQADRRAQLYDLTEAIGGRGSYGTGQWPLPNVWLGVSAERQIEWNERVHELIATDAACRLVSIEPMLSPIDISVLGGEWVLDPDQAREAVRRGLKWIIVGGESGAGARPMHPDWARNVRDQAKALGLKFFFKQWGAWEPRAEWTPHGTEVAINPDGSETPYDVNPDDIGGQRMALVGKAAAGRTLDGRTHDERPPLVGQAQ